MLKQLLTAGLLLASGAVLAQPESPCITNELERDSVTATLALEIGKYHLAAASNGPDGLPALEYAHSWFLQAQALGAADAQRQLETTHARLQLAAEAQ